MKSVSGVATSRAEGRPWGRIFRDTAITKCTDLGQDYGLMTNDEWQTVARDIELIPGNWGGEQVGSAQGLSIGNSSSTSRLTASVDDNQACEGITLGQGETCAGRIWHAERRTLTLKNGQVIWDLAGNVWEWMKDDNDLQIWA